MIVLTFDEYDALYEEIENMEGIKNLKFESPEVVFQKLNKDNDYLKEVIKMLVFTTDKEYEKKLNKILNEILYLVDAEKDKNILKNQVQQKNAKYNLTLDELQEMTDQVKTMDFQCIYWYPSVSDLKNFQFYGTKNDVAFLLWLINTELELTEEEKKSREFAQKILQEKIQIKGAK